MDLKILRLRSVPWSAKQPESFDKFVNVYSNIDTKSYDLDNLPTNYFCIEVTTLQHNMDKCKQLIIDSGKYIFKCQFDTTCYFLNVRVTDNEYEFYNFYYPPWYELDRRPGGRIIKTSGDASIQSEDIICPCVVINNNDWDNLDDLSDWVDPRFDKELSAMFTFTVLTEYSGDNSCGSNIEIFLVNKKIPGRLTKCAVIR